MKAHMAAGRQVLIVCSQDGSGFHWIRLRPRASQVNNRVS